MSPDLFWDIFCKILLKLPDHNWCLPVFYFLPRGLDSLNRFIRKFGVLNIWMCKCHCQISSTCVGFGCVPVVMLKTPDTLSWLQLTFGLGSWFFGIFRNFTVILYFADHSWMSYNHFLKQLTIYSTEISVQYRSSAYAVYIFILPSVSWVSNSWYML